jgi:hypothetical protein
MTRQDAHRSRCTSIPIPGHPEAHFHVRGESPPTAEDVAALQALGKVLVERYRDVVPVMLVPAPFDIVRVTRGAETFPVAVRRTRSRRKRKQDVVHASLRWCRARRRTWCPAKEVRASRDFYRAHERIAEGCRCCVWCGVGACEEVFQGAPCARRCVCDESDRDDELLDDFYDENDELDYGEGWEGES